MTGLPYTTALLAALASAALGGCGDDGAGERERLLEERLAQAEARAARAEGEVATARRLLSQQASAGGNEFDDSGGDNGFEDLAGLPDDAAPDGSNEPN